MRPPDQPLRRLEELGTTFGGLLLFGMCIMGFGDNAWRVFQSSDTAWLVKTGEYIIEHGLPKTDIFSWSRAGQPWVVYQWLFEVVAGWLYRTGGLWAVGLGAYMMAAAVYLWLMPSQMLRLGVRLPYVAGLLLLALSPIWFWARPQLVSFILIPVFINILERFRTAGNIRVLWLLPPLMVLWANFHSFWFVGLFMVTVYILAALPKSSGPVKLRLCATLLASILAVFINPYGGALISYNLSFLSQTDFSISELQPYLLSDAEGNKQILLYFALAWSIILAGRRHVPLAGLILSAISTIAAIACFRFTPVAILLTWPFAGLALSNWYFSREELPSDRQSSGNISTGPTLWRALPAVATAACLCFYTNKFPLNGPVWFTHTQSNQKAVAFLKAHPNLPKRMFCDASLGCSLILEGLGPVFIDTRFDFYGINFRREYLNCLNAQGDWQGYLNNWQISSIGIPSNSPLSRELIRSDSWSMIYEDGSSSIWVKL